MSAESQLDRIEAELRAIRAEVRARISHPEPGSYTLGGAARALGVSTSTVQRMLVLHQLEPIMVGKQKRIPRSEVQRVLTPGRVTASMPELGQRPTRRGLRRSSRGAPGAKVEAFLKSRRKKPVPPSGP